MRKREIGTSEKPRISVFKSNTSVFVQLIDDVKGVTLHSCSSRKILGKDKRNCTVEIARKVGEEVGRKAVAAGIDIVFFDRGNRKFHGQIKAVADGARSSGLKF